MGERKHTRESLLDFVEDEVHELVVALECADDWMLSQHVSLLLQTLLRNKHGCVKLTTMT
jgi:uncharacterized protein YabN with tetrapyrrole methylase and pyrophosphatase domain